MAEPIKAMVVDLSHWDPAQDYEKVADAGIVGCIYKATEGSGYNDPTYTDQQKAAKKAGVKWGAYHFANGEDVDQQVANFLAFAAPDPDELFALDWEDNPSGSKMSLAQVKEWITKVEHALNRPDQCVLYGGNTIKEALGDSTDEFFARRRLWLCQYASNPVIPDCWNDYWLWQYTDGQVGPNPHAIDGIGPCDINSYRGTASELAAEWASGTPQPMPVPPEPGMANVYLNISTSGEVAVSIAINNEVVYGDSEG